MCPNLIRVHGVNKRHGTWSPWSKQVGQASVKKRFIDQYLYSLWSEYEICMNFGNSPSNTSPSHFSFFFSKCLVVIKWLFLHHWDIGKKFQIFIVRSSLSNQNLFSLNDKKKCTTFSDTQCWKWDHHPNTKYVIHNSSHNPNTTNNINIDNTGNTNLHTFNKVRWVNSSSHSLKTTAKPKEHKQMN